MNSVLPNPFELFKKKEKENLENKEPNGKLNKETISNVKKKPKYFILPLTIAFSALFFVSVFIYYVINTLLYKNISTERYTNIPTKDGQPNDFWYIFRSKVIESRFWTFVLLWGFVVFINIIMLSEVFKIKESVNIFTITSILFITIVGSTFFIIGNIPSLVEVFENTFGYFIINTFFGLKDTMKHIFKTKQFDKTTEGEDSKFEMPFNILITPFDIPKFNDMFDALPKDSDGEADFYLNPDLTEEQLEDVRKNILKLVFIKNNVGHFTWIYVASVITILATINTML
jgi:hypothetical protein